ncbi:MAG TPA: SCO family protein, partial [Blastocatellia bacterium]
MIDRDALAERKPKLISILIAAALCFFLDLSSYGQEHQHHHPSEKPRNESGGMKIEFPDVELLDQEDKPIHFYSDLIKGRVVAINFIFTTCTTICPPMGATF